MLVLHPEPLDPVQCLGNAPPIGLCFCLQRLAPATLLWRLLLGCEPFVHKCRSLDMPGGVHLPPPSLRPLTKGSWMCRGRFCLSLASPGPSLGLTHTAERARLCLRCQPSLLGPPPPPLHLLLGALHTSPISGSASGEHESGQ